MSIDKIPYANNYRNGYNEQSRMINESTNNVVYYANRIFEEMKEDFKEVKKEVKEQELKQLAKIIYCDEPMKVTTDFFNGDGVYRIVKRGDKEYKLTFDFKINGKKGWYLKGDYSFIEFQKIGNEIILLDLKDSWTEKVNTDTEYNVYTVIKNMDKIEINGTGASKNLKKDTTHYFILDYLLPLFKDFDSGTYHFGWDTQKQEFEKIGLGFRWWGEVMTTVKTRTGGGRTLVLYSVLRGDAWSTPFNKGNWIGGYYSLFGRWI